MTLFLRAVTLLFLFLTYLRIYFGVDFTDEAQYVGSALLTAKGGKPFFNELFIQQSASLLYEPLLSLYHFYFKTTGVILFVRHLYFLLAFFTYFQLSRLFRHSLNPQIADLIALIPVTFIPHSLPSLSYNTIGALTFGSALALYLRSELEHRAMLRNAAAGLFGLCLFAYPSFIVGISLFFFLSIPPFQSNPKKSPWNWKELALTLTGLSSVFGLLWVISIWRFGWENIETSWNYSRAFGTLGDPLVKFEIALGAALEQLPSLWILGGLFLVWFLCSPRGVASSFLLICGAFSFINLFWTEKVGPPPTHAMIVYLSLWGSVGLFWLLGRSWILRKHSGASSVWDFSIAENQILRNHVIRWVLPSILTAFALCWTSSMTLFSMTLSAQFALAGLLFYFALFFFERRKTIGLIQNDKAPCGEWTSQLMSKWISEWGSEWAALVGPWTRWAHWGQGAQLWRGVQGAIAISIIALLVSQMIWTYRYVYRDDNMNELNTWVHQGPYAGLITSSSRVAWMNEIQSDLQRDFQVDSRKKARKEARADLQTFDNQGSPQTILFYDSFPAGYLFSELVPACRGLFTQPLFIGYAVRPFLQKYYSVWEHQPDIFFRFTSLPLTQNENQILVPSPEIMRLDPFYNFLPSSPRYRKVLTRAHYEIWVKID